MSSEERRLAALHALGLLDTPAEERFDRIARLAARALDAPIALVSLVDAHRQFLKARIGIARREIPRDISFCAHALGRPGPLVVHDATADPRFAENPQVTGHPGIRFYAGHPIHAAGGHPVGALSVMDTRPRRPAQADLVVLRDLAHLAELEANARDLSVALAARRAGEERLRAVLDGVADGIVAVDSAARVELISAAAATMLGRDPAASIGLPARDVLGCDLPAARQGRIELRRADGAPQHVRYTLVPASTPEGGAVLTFRDAAEEHRVARAQDRFLRVAAHELRTPLTSIRGYAEELLDDADPALGTMERDSVTAILRNADRLQALLEDMLLVLRLETGQVELDRRRIDLYELAAAAVREARAEASRADVRLLVEGSSVRAVGDEQLLRRALRGLLRNGIADSPRGSPLRVEVIADEAAAHVAVSDAGVRLGDNERRMAAEPFRRGETTGPRAGTGLDLPIARGVAAAHGGRLELSPGAPTGTTVRLVLPRS